MSGLTREETVQLLATVAVLDDVDGLDDPYVIGAWQDMSRVGEWESLAAARQALLVYRSEHPDYPLKPGHITGILERVRRQARESFDPSRERLPQAAADDPRAYQAWIAQRAEAHKRELFARFVAGDNTGRRALPPVDTT